MFLLTVLIVLALLYVIKGVIIVQQAEVVIVERLGKFQRVLESGLNFIVPFLDSPRGISWKIIQKGIDGASYSYIKEKTRIDLRESVYDFPQQNVITKDNVSIRINALLYFQIVDPKSAVYEIQNLPDAIEKLTQTTLRNLVGQLDLDETLVSRDKINHELRAILDEATNKWGVKVNRVELQDIIPPTDIQQAMEKQMKAERDRRETLLQAEGHKAAAVTRAQGDKEAAILQAEGERDARIARAEGEAKEIYLKKKAEADGYKALIEAGITPEVLELKRYETLAKVADGQASKVIIPTDVVESTNKNILFSETTGLGEITKQGTHPAKEPKEDPCCERFEKK